MKVLVWDLVIFFGYIKINIIIKKCLFRCYLKLFCGLLFIYILYFVKIGLGGFFKFDWVVIVVIYLLLVIYLCLYLFNRYYWVIIIYGYVLGMGDKRGRGFVFLGVYN